MKFKCPKQTTVNRFNKEEYKVSYSKIQGFSDDHIWSFSAISGFEQCPLSFKLKYIDKEPSVNNGFADFGSLVHKVLEMYANGTITADDCSGIYEMLFEDSVKAPYPKYPPNMKHNAYLRGVEYFNNFAGFGSDYTIVGVEKNIQGNIGPHKFRGIIDLVLEEDKTKQRTICDHKTKSDSSMKKELELYKKQLYMYAHLHIAEYGFPPKQLAFNMINAKTNAAKKKKMLMFNFDESEYKAAVNWAEDTINEILLADEFEGRYNQYFCDNLCGVRESCEVRQEMANDDRQYL